MRKAKDHLLWTENSRVKLASVSVFDFYLSRRTAAGGQSGDFALIAAPDWVNVVPVLRGASGEIRFLMVRQYRHGIEEVTTEFPAGLVNPGEEPRAAAARELQEETGRIAGRLTLLGKICPNPPFMGNWCYTYLAEDLSAAAGQALDRLEVLDVVEISKAELEASLGTGEYMNSLVMVALLWYTLRKVPPA
jgi:ADP-ribose pyrophosphatase